MSVLSEDVSRVVSCLERLGRKFIRHPHLFYTESDMHCYLYYLLYAGRTFKGFIETIDGKRTILLHKELPTTGRYSRDSQGLLVPSEKKGKRRGRFDIAIINGLNSKEYDLKRQRALIAVELGLDEDITYEKYPAQVLCDGSSACRLSTIYYSLEPFMFLHCQLPVLSMVRFVSRQHHMHDR